MSRDVILRITQGLDTSQPWYPKALEFVGQLSCWLQKQSSSSDVNISNIQDRFQEQLESELEQRIFQASPVSQMPEETAQLLLSTMLEASQRQLLNFPQIPAALILCHNHSTPRNGHWFLPGEIAELMVGLLDMPEGSSLYCPFDENITLIPKTQTGGHIVNEITGDSLLALISHYLQSDSCEIAFSNPLTHPTQTTPGGLKHFDFSACAPQPNDRIQVSKLNDLYGRFPEQPLYGDVVYIRHLLSQTLKRTAVVVSNAMLQRTKGKEREFKRWLLKNGMVKAVIKLPGRSIPGYRNTASLLLLDRQENTSDILLFDASAPYFKSSGRNGLSILKNSDAVIESILDKKTNDYCCRVPVKEIIANDTNLDVLRYLPKKTARQTSKGSERQFAPLEELVELIRAQAIPNNAEHSTNHVLEVTPVNINNAGDIEQPDKTVFFGVEHHRRVQLQRLKPGDILLAIKGNTGRSGLVPEICGDNWVAGQAFQILRLKTGAPIKDSRILFQYLNSTAGKHYLSSIRSGTGVAFLQTQDIRRMPIPLLTSEEQNLALQSWHEIRKIHAEISYLQEKISVQQSRLWESG
ncbi:type I restriction-modification system subunit M/S [Sansalvadorimonas verongulae]|uniref:type I restriction-modification system subunit M/S n=1 Tax=Sansalvadorimonas verongulae TaxID=2172824 RepID=UPI0012BB9E35|nr:type I restriction-modification system subunit M/S [Sansalvadorimonas verongulae]MTI12714.1 restriction endonuclease subunit M/S [Sansalvadorimonas verongulae]